MKQDKLILANGEEYIFGEEYWMWTNKKALAMKFKLRGYRNLSGNNCFIVGNNNYFECISKYDPNDKTTRLYNLRVICKSESEANTMIKFIDGNFYGKWSENMQVLVFDHQSKKFFFTSHLSNESFSKTYISFEQACSKCDIIPEKQTQPTLENLPESELLRLSSESLVSIILKNRDK